MAKNTAFKGVVVKEDSKTSLKAAGIHPMTLADGTKIVALAHLYYPYHDRSLVDVVMKYLRETKPELVFLLGGIVAEDAFRTLVDEEINFLHDQPEVPEVVAAQHAGLFEEQVIALGKTCGDFIKSIQRASGGNVIYVPSATHLSMPNEVRLMEFLDFKKRNFDDWSANHPESKELPSDPMMRLPKTLEGLLGLTRSKKITVLRYNAGVLINDDVLFMIGDFRRRNAGDASWEDWVQRGVSCVRSFDGKVASSWKTTHEHSLPGLNLKHHQAHEIGFLWDQVYMSHLRDYDRRAPGIWAGEIVCGKVDGQSHLARVGGSGRRTFFIDLKPYTEEEPVKVFSEELKLA